MSENIFRGNLTPTSEVLRGSISSSESITGSLPQQQSLKGKAIIPDKIYGDSAYEIAVKNGFEGTEVEWLASLNGESSYDIAVKNGFDGTESEWLASLKGDVGSTPIKGVDY